MGISSARGGTVQKNAETHQMQSVASADGAGSARAAQRPVRQPSNRDVSPGPH